MVCRLRQLLLRMKVESQTDRQLVTWNDLYCSTTEADCLVGIRGIVERIKNFFMVVQPPPLSLTKIDSYQLVLRWEGFWANSTAKWNMAKGHASLRVLQLYHRYLKSDLDFKFKEHGLKQFDQSNDEHQQGSLSIYMDIVRKQLAGEWQKFTMKRYG